MSKSHFAEFLRILKRHRVRFLVVAGYAMAHHGLVRATNYIHVLVATERANEVRVRAAALDSAVVLASLASVACSAETASSPEAVAANDDVAVESGAPAEEREILPLSGEAGVATKTGFEVQGAAATGMALAGEPVVASLLPSEGSVRRPRNRGHDPEPHRVR